MFLNPKRPIFKQNGLKYKNSENKLVVKLKFNNNDIFENFKNKKKLPQKPNFPKIQ